MKKILDLLKKLASQKVEEEVVYEIHDHSKETLDLNALVNNSLVF